MFTRVDARVRGCVRVDVRARGCVRVGARARVGARVLVLCDQYSSISNVSSHVDEMFGSFVFGTCGKQLNLIAAIQSEVY